MKNFLEIIETIKEIKGFKTDTEVASFFEISRQNLSNYKTLNRIPFEMLISFCERENVSLDWLLLGREHPSVEPDDIADLKRRLAAVEKKLK